MRQQVTTGEAGVRKDMRQQTTFTWARKTTERPSAPGLGSLRLYIDLILGLRYTGLQVRPWLHLAVPYRHGAVYV